MKTKERETTNTRPIRANAVKVVERLNMDFGGKKYDTQFTITGKKKNVICMSCIKYFLFFPELVNWVSYFFPENFIYSFSTPFTVLSFLGFVFVFSRSLVFISPASIFLSYWFICSSSSWYSYISSV